MQSAKCKIIFYNQRRSPDILHCAFYTLHLKSTPKGAFFYDFNVGISIGDRKDNYDIGYQDSTWAEYVKYLSEGGKQYCIAYTELGYKICKSLESQGYLMEDSREID